MARSKAGLAVAKNGRGGRAGGDGEAATNWKLTPYGCLSCWHCRVDKERQWCARGGNVEMGRAGCKRGEKFEPALNRKPID